VFATAGLVTLAPNTSGGLTKQGNGVLTLGAANTYTGVTTVAGGTLKLGNAAALPTQTRVVLAGGTLDLSGYTVTNTISGAGTLANGTVETVLSPGGEGVVATDTLPLAASVTLKGTYLLDVTTAGDSDLVAVQGDVNLDNLALQVVDPNLLDRTKTYTIMTCAGTRTGKFTPVNLPDSRWRVIYGADGSVKLFFVTGTVVILR
jgi:autotransporter-associated beta strand protein